MGESFTPLSTFHELKDQVIRAEGATEARFVGVERDVATAKNQSDDNRNSIRKVGWAIALFVLLAALRSIFVETPLGQG